MRVVVKTPSGEAIDFEVDPADPLIQLKCLIESANPDLGSADSIRLSLKEVILGNDDASLNDVQYQEGDVLIVCGDAPMEQATETVQTTMTTIGGKGAGKGPDRPGVVPTTGFQAVNIVVANCSNTNTNGVYLPAKPYADKPVWYKAPSDEDADATPGEGDAKSKDRGERLIYYSAQGEKWFVGDALEEGGFTFVRSAGKAEMPNSGKWYNEATVEFESDASEGELNAQAALKEMEKLINIEPWADQEVCYVTMLKVLGNIAANPGEEKFCSLKIENAAIKNKILRHDGARGFLEALGFREGAGVLTLPKDCSNVATMAQNLLQGFANEAAYQNIRKERHAKAALEVKKEAARPKARTYGGGKDGDDGEARFGKGPMRG